MPFANQFTRDFLLLHFSFYIVVQSFLNTIPASCIRRWAPDSRPLAHDLIGQSCAESGETGGPSPSVPDGNPFAKQGRSAGRFFSYFQRALKSPCDGSHV